MIEGGIGERNKGPVDENELVLDGGFVVPETMPDEGFVAPDTNSFGHTFRSCSLRFFLNSYKISV